jgi:hypothetical protein
VEELQFMGCGQLAEALQQRFLKHLFHIHCPHIPTYAIGNDAAVAAIQDIGEA